MHPGYAVAPYLNIGIRVARGDGRGEVGAQAEAAGPSFEAGLDVKETDVLDLFE